MTAYESHLVWVLTCPGVRRDVKGDLTLCSHRNPQFQGVKEKTMSYIWKSSRIAFAGFRRGLYRGITRCSVSQPCSSLYGLKGGMVYARSSPSMVRHRYFCSFSESGRPIEEQEQTDTEQDFWEHSHFMKLALDQARIAHGKGEVPVGAILVGPDGNVLSKGHNTTEQDRDPTSHAEMQCIRHASSLSGGWRLLDCTLYVTLEPCPMCAGAILQSRVGTLVYGARNTLLGADGSWVHMLPSEHSQCDESIGDEDDTKHTIQNPIIPRTPHPFHPNIKVIRGVMAEECSGIMKDFFSQRRKKSNKISQNIRG